MAAIFQFIVEITPMKPVRLNRSINIYIIKYLNFNIKPLKKYKNGNSKTQKPTENETLPNFDAEK